MVILLIKGEMSLNGSDATRTRSWRARDWARAEERTRQFHEENDAFREEPCFMC